MEYKEQPSTHEDQERKAKSILKDYQHEVPEPMLKKTQDFNFYKPNAPALPPMMISPPNIA